MSNRRYEFGVIVLIGIIVGLVLSYISRDIQTPPEVLVLLGTVQGSFLAIVISVFLLTLQVNASEFSPLTLEQFGRSNVLIGLVLLYVSSILIDVLYVTTLTNPLYTIPINLNLSLGIPSAIATVCLLSLIPVQRVMANLVAPETVLRRTVDNANFEDLIQDQPTTDSPTRPDINPPERTPLLTIEQILVSSAERDDEYSVRQSIYYMYDAISTFLNQCNQDKTSCDRESGKDPLSEIDVNSQCKFAFEHWKRCVDIGIKGTKSRLYLLNATHLQLTKLTLSIGASESIDERMEEFERIHINAFKLGYTETSLLKSYRLLIQSALESDQIGEIENILSSLLSVCEGVVINNPDQRDYVNYLSGERRDIIGKCLSDTIQHISTIINKSEVSDKFARRTSRNAIKQIDIILVELFENLTTFEDDPDVDGIKQNVLKGLQSSIIDAAPCIYENDNIVGENLAMAAVEISLYRKQNPDQFLEQLSQTAEDQQTVSNIVKDMNSSDPKEYFQQLSVDKKEINSFTQKLASQSECTTSKQRLSRRYPET
jgi:hypothetical protein